MAEETEKAAKEEEKAAEETGEAEEEKEESAKAEEKASKAEEGAAKAEEKAAKAETKKAGKEKTPKEKSTEPKQAGGAGAAAGAVSSFKNRGFPLFIAAAIVFVISQIFGIPAIYGYISLFFMLYSSVVVFERKGVFIILIFAIWYVVYGAPDITTIKSWIVPIIISGALLHGLVGKLSGKESFSGGAGKEAIFGLGHILVFFIDVGITEWVVGEFGVSLPYFIERLIILIPLWAYIGLYVMIADETEKTGVTKFSTVVGIAYLVVIILLISGPAQAVEGERLLPGMEELVKAKQEAVEKQNPLVSELACTWKTIGEPGLDKQKCLQEREIKYTCETIRGFEYNTDDYKECFAEEEEAKKVPLAAGRISPLMKKPTKAEFKVEDFPLKINEEIPSDLVIDLVIENPRRLKIDVVVSCSFKKGAETIPGIIAENTFTTEEESPAQTIVCKPEQELEEGSYTVAYEAVLSNLETTSYLTKLFVGQKTKEEKDKLKGIYFPGREDYRSWSAKELAGLSFELGQPRKYPLIDFDDKPVLILTLENLGSGEIIKVSEYSLDLEQYGLRTDPKCLRKTDIVLPKTAQKKTLLAVCENVEIPPELKKPKKVEPIEFTALLKYDYKIKKELTTRVELLIS